MTIEVSTLSPEEIHRGGLPSLPTHWRWVRFEDVCKRVSVGHVGPTTEFFCDRTDGILFLRSQNVRPGHLDLESAAAITREFHQRLKKSQLQPGDILFVRVGANRGDCCVVPEGIGEINCANIVFARPHHPTGFHAYFFQSDLGRSLLLSASVGAAQGVINTASVASMPVPLPPLQVQRRIAGILSAYDDLIENNQRRIKILEEMARSLYREWFVHFRFPGHAKGKMVPSPLGQIPQGWEVKTVEEIVMRIPVGRKYDQKTVNPTGVVPVFDQGKSGIIGYHDDEPGVVASETAPVIVFANHTCYQRLVHIPFSAIQNVLPFAPSPSLPRNIYWLHWATNGLVAFNDYKGHWPEFSAKTVIVPPSELCQRFGEFSAPLSLQGMKLECQIQNLRRTRDLLLPRLLLGKVGLQSI